MTTQATVGQDAGLEALANALRHFEANDLAAAAALCGAIPDRSPHHWLALRLRGAIHGKQGEHEQAARLLTAALHAVPANNAGAVGALLNELAAALLEQQDLLRAEDCYRRALAIAPHDVRTLENLASTLVMLNRHADALQQFRLAREIADAPRLQLSEGAAMLALGQWQEGWRRIEARFAMPELNPNDRFPTDIPHWRGETDIAGRSILVHAEQGLGDTLLMLRYALLLAVRGAHVVLRVQPLLGKLLAGFPGVASVLTYRDAVPPVDVQCPMFSLPLAFNTTLADVPAPVPYLRPAAEYLLLWQALLGLQQRRRIGIVWHDRRRLPPRSMPLNALAPLLRRSDLEFHVIQKEVAECDRAWLEQHGAIDHSADLKDFADTAALISHLDLVITVDTSIAHVAGALGKPVWIMLPFSADWRWLIGRSDSPWYPTARLFRQARPGDWDSVVATVTRALSG